MFPWLKEAFNAEVASEIKNFINNVNLVDQNLIKQPLDPSASLENALRTVQQQTQSPEIQLKKIKRFFDENKAKSANNSFKINSNTIIRTQDSRNNGALYLNETELPSNEECLKWCLKNKKCNLAVYEEKVDYLQISYLVFFILLCICYYIYFFHK